MLGLSFVIPLLLLVLTLVFVLILVYIAWELLDWIIRG